MLHQSAHVRATEASISADDFPLQSTVLLLVTIIYFLNVCITGVIGPSNVDACCWRHMCASFKEVSTGLGNALTAVAWHLCTTQLKDPAVL